MSKLINFIENNWYRKNKTFLACFLLPFSKLFSLIIYIRSFLYEKKLIKSYSFSVPIIVVGNIAVGGTGKTPLVIWLAKFLQSRGYTPGIVSRGAGGIKHAFPKMVNAESDCAVVGDEAVLLSKRANCPVVICVNRPKAVNFLLENSVCDIVISDDGLQHYALNRNVEMAVVDGERQFGNGLLLPAGPLRESINRLQNVDFIIMNGQAKESKFNLKHTYSMHLEGEFLYSISSMDKLSLHNLANKKVHAICAIGNPKRFFNYLRQFKIEVIEHIFPDHYQFKQNDFNFGSNEIIVMTEKDAVKCKQFATQNHWFLPVEAVMEVNFGKDLINRLQKSVEKKYEITETC